MSSEQIVERILDQKLLYEIHLKVILNGLVEGYRIALGNGSAYDIYFVSLSTESQLLLAILGKGANKFTRGSYISAYYVEEKLNIPLYDAKYVAKILNYLLYKQEWADNVDTKKD